MSEELYRVVFTGRLVEGVSGKQALENLTRLFRKTPEEIRTVFSKPGTVIRSKQSLLKAEKMLAGLTQAGVLCQLQLMPNDAVVKTTASSVGEKPLPIVVTGSAPQVFALTSVKADLTLNPISCGRISSHPGGIETTRLDRSFIAFTDILAVTVFALAEGNNDLKLILFTAGHKRPLLIDGMQISFGEFPGVADLNLPTSLRNFLTFLASQNPELCADEKTAAYMQGGAPLVWGDEPLHLASQIHASLLLAEIALERQAINAPDPGTVVEVKPVIRPLHQALTEEERIEERVPVREIDLRGELEKWVDRWPPPC